MPTNYDILVMIYVAFMIYYILNIVSEEVKDMSKKDKEKKRVLLDEKAINKKITESIDVKPPKDRE